MKQQTPETAKSYEQEPNTYESDFREDIYLEKLNNDEQRKADIIQGGLRGLSEVDSQGLLAPGKLKAFIEGPPEPKVTKISVEYQPTDADTVVVQVQ